MVDPAGPVTYVVAGAALRALAEERVPRPMYADEEVASAVRGLVADAPDVTDVRLVPAEGVDARILLTVRPGARLEPLLSRLGPALQRQPVLRERTLRGLDVAVQPG